MACKPKRNKRLTNHELHRNKLEGWAKFGAEDHENFYRFFTDDDDNFSSFSSSSYYCRHAKISEQVVFLNFYLLS